MHDARAARPLRFLENPLLSGGQYVSDYREVTFLHRCLEKQRYSYVSRQWRKHMVPCAAHPGRDVGMTEEDYAWLLCACRANADWQLNVRVNIDGRLLQIAKPKFENRGEPLILQSGGSMPQSRAKSRRERMRGRE